MIGTELAHKPGLSWKLRGYARLFGNPQLGELIRQMYFRRNVRGLDLDRDGVRILDAGCGWGPYCYWLGRRFPKARVTGVEFSPETVEKNRTIARRLGLANVEFEAQDLLARSGGGEYDLVLLIDVIEHIVDDDTVLASAARSLKPGGHLYLHVPAKVYRSPISQALADEMTFFKEHVRTGYSLEELEGKAKAHGLEVAASGHGWRAVATWLYDTMRWAMRKAGNPHLRYAIVPPARLLLPFDLLCSPRTGNTTYVLARKPLTG